MLEHKTIPPADPNLHRWQGREQRFGVPEVSPRVVELDLPEPLAATIQGREEVAAMAAEGIAPDEAADDDVEESTDSEAGQGDEGSSEPDTGFGLHEVISDECNYEIELVDEARLRLLQAGSRDQPQADMGVGPVPREQLATLAAAERALQQADDVAMLLEQAEEEGASHRAAREDAVGAAMDAAGELMDEVLGDDAAAVAAGEEPRSGSGGGGMNAIEAVAYNELSSCTGAFSERHLLGQGGQSKVYRGSWGSLLETVAIKLITHHDLLGERGFQQEIAALTPTQQHCNALLTPTPTPTGDCRPEPMPTSQRHADHRCFLRWSTEGHCHAVHGRGDPHRPLGPGARRSGPT